MENEPPKCKDCGQTMFEVGKTGRTIQTCDMDGKVYAARSEKLYQCPEDKTVAIL